MFEKEAKEYRNHNTNYYEWDSFCADDGEAVEEAYQKGAIDGYNKAKEEWKKHFMQCSSPFCLDIFSSVKCYGELGNMAKKEGEEK